MPISLPSPPEAPFVPYSVCTDGSFNGFTWGLYGGQAWLLSQTGIDDLPSFRRTESPRSRRPGWFRGPSYPDARTVTLQFALKGADDGTLQANMDAFLAAMTPQDEGDPIPLYVLCSTRVLFARVSRRTNPYDRERFAGAPRPTVEFLCTDPRLYDATLTTLTGSPAVITGGAIFPATFPLTFPGSSSGGPLAAVNAGDYPAPCVMTIRGPVNHPPIRLINETTGETLAFNLTLGMSDALTLDTDAQSVALNGVASGFARTTMEPGSRWWQLQPGANRILYETAGADVDSTITLTYRSAWL